MSDLRKKLYSNFQKGHGKGPMGNPPPPCDLDENRCTFRSSHAKEKSPWPRSRRTHPLTYRGHRRSHYRGMGRTLWKNCPGAILMKIGILIHVCHRHLICDEVPVTVCMFAC